MKILRVIKSTDPASGGPFEALVQRSEVLRQHGHEVEVVSLDAPEDAARRSFPFPLTPLGRGIGRYGFNPKLAPWIRANAGRFDVVILHGLWNYSSFGAWRGLRKLSTPYVIFSHGMLDPWFRGKYPLKHAFKQLYWWFAEGKVLRDAKRVMFSCEEEERRARGTFLGYNYSGTVVHYGTSEHAGDFAQESKAFLDLLPVLRGSEYLLFVGRIHPIKGCDHLIRGFAAATATIPQNVHLVLTGPDQVGWKSELQDLSHELGISHRIHWTGMLVGDQKWGALRNAAALILPSHQESFGMVIAEAMACGTPVLISDKVNTWREVNKAGAGMIAPDNAEGAQSLIQNFFALDTGERNALACNARKGFADFFDVSQAAADLENALNSGSRTLRQRNSNGLRVLHVIRSTEAATGGPIEWLYRLSESLASEGHSIEIVSLDDKDDSACMRLPFPVTSLGRGVGKYGFNWRLAPWIRRNAHRFDVVIMHGLWNYSSVGAWRGLRGTNTPYLIFPHGMMDPWFRDHYPMKHVKKRVYWSVAEGRVLRDASRVVFTCEEEKERARGVFGHQGYSEHVVRLGTMDPKGNAEVQRSVFYSAFPRLRKRRYLLFLSRIHPKKGCDILLEAFASSIDELPPDVDLVIAGPDRLGMVPRLRELARRLGIESRVHWSGMMDGDLKWGAFRCAEAFIFPSHQENFGIVVAESMACGTPVLISDKVNIWREIEIAGAGLIESDSLEGTRSLLSRYFSLTAQQREHIRECAREGYLRFFKIERAASELSETIEDILVEAGQWTRQDKPETISV